MFQAQKAYSERPLKENYSRFEAPMALSLEAVWVFLAEMVDHPHGYNPPHGARPCEDADSIGSCSQGKNRAAARSHHTPPGRGGSWCNSFRSVVDFPIQYLMPMRHITCDMYKGSSYVLEPNISRQHSRASSPDAKDGSDPIVLPHNRP